MAEMMVIVAHPRAPPYSFDYLYFSERDRTISPDITDDFDDESFMNFFAATPRFDEVLIGDSGQRVDPRRNSAESPREYSGDE